MTAQISDAVRTLRRGACPVRHATPRTVLIALASPVAGRVRSYVTRLLETGAEVEIVTLRAAEWERFADVPGVRLHPLQEAEERHPLPRLERAVVHTVPRTLLAGARRLAARAPRRTPVGVPLRAPLTRGVGHCARLHRKAAHAAHRGGYVALVRPLLLARLARTAVRGIDFTAVDRIVAADTVSVVLGCRLARAHPSIVATTALEKPGTEPGTGYGQRQQGRGPGQAQGRAQARGHGQRGRGQGRGRGRGQGRGR